MSKDRGTPIEYGVGPYSGDSAYPADQFHPDAVPPGMKFALNPPHPHKALLRLVAFLVIVSALLILLQTVIFRLKTVYVVGNDTLSAEYIVSLTGLHLGDNIFAVTEDTLRDKLEADHWIILNHFYKRYPNEIYLFVDEREIVATMQWLGIEYTLDINGMVLDEYSGMDYAGEVPTVYGFGISNAVVGELLSVRSDSQLVAYSAIVSELNIQQYASHVFSINVSDVDSLSLLTMEGITVQLGTSDSMRAKIGAMRTDIAYLQQLGETSGVLDVTQPEDGKFRRE
jgi:cell division septal protein FtsQ